MGQVQIDLEEHSDALAALETLSSFERRAGVWVASSLLRGCIGSITLFG